MTRSRGKVGDVLQISLGNSLLGYGRVLEEPYMAFYGIFTYEDKYFKADSVIDLNPLFVVAVANYATKESGWRVIGNFPLEPRLLVTPRFFKQDPINKKLFIYESGKETPASVDECKGLERAAVWEPKHIVERLRNHQLGVSDPMTERLKLPTILGLDSSRRLT